MERTEQRSSVLIAAQSEKIAVQIKGILPAGFGRVTFQPSMARVKQTLTEERADLLIIYTPLSDDSGVQSILDLSVKYPAMSILLIVSKEAYQQVLYRAGDTGITVLARPISTGTFVSAIQMLGAMSRKIQRLLEENAKLQRKLEDERYVSRAKALLIEKKGMTEGEAHKYLERQAMNGSVTRREVALKIIRESGRIIVGT